MNSSAVIFSTGKLIYGSLSKINIPLYSSLKYILVLNFIIIQYLLSGYDNTSLTSDNISMSLDISFK